MRTRRLAAIVGAACVLIGACSVPKDDQAHPIDSELLPEFSPRPKSCNSNGPTVEVYGVKVTDTGRTLEPVERHVAEPPEQEAALEQLIECPPSEADAAKVTTNIPEVRLEGLQRIDEDNVEIRLRWEGKDEPITQLDALPAAQMLFTITGGDYADDVVGVRWTLDGVPLVALTTGAEVPATDFKTRKDYEPLTPPTTTTTTTTSTTTTTVVPDETTTTTSAP